MNFFRILSPDEKIEFKLWARNNYTLLSPIDPLWHPVVQNECIKMNCESFPDYSTEGN